MELFNIPDRYQFTGFKIMDSNKSLPSIECVGFCRYVLYCLLTSVPLPTVRQAARRAVKRYKRASSGSESDSDSEPDSPPRRGRRKANGRGKSNGHDSDFKMSGPSALGWWLS